MHVQSVQLRVSLTGRYATALYKEAYSTKSIEVILSEVTERRNCQKRRYRQ